MIIKRLKVILLLLTVIFLISCNKQETENLSSSRNYIKWAGSYRGVIPNFDDQGVYVELEIDSTLTFTKRTKKLGASENYNTIDGKFTWTKDGNRIILESDYESKNSTLIVEKNRVLWENIMGIEYTADEAENYALTKVPGILIDKEWRITKISDKHINIRSTRYSNYIYIDFSSEENKIYGYSGSNFFNAYYHLNGDKISFTPVKSTKMAGPNIEIERALFKNLQQIEQFEIVENELYLKNELGIHLIAAEANNVKK